MKDLKVGLISHDFPPEGFGGIAIYTYNLAKALSEKGLDVTVICGNKGKKGKYNKEKFKVIRLNMPNIPPRAIWFQMLNKNKLRKEFSKFDILNCQYTSGYIFVKNINKPIITTFHDSPKKELELFLKTPIKYWTSQEFFYNVLEYPIYHNVCKNEFKISNKIISVSKSLTCDLKKEFGTIGKISTIPNGLNMSDFEDIESEDDNKTILYFGRLFY